MPRSIIRTVTIAIAIAALAAPTAFARPADMPPAVAKAAAAEQHKQARLGPRQRLPDPPGAGRAGQPTAGADDDRSAHGARRARHRLDDDRHRHRRQPARPRRDRRHRRHPPQRARPHHRLTNHTSRTGRPQCPKSLVYAFARP